MEFDGQKIILTVVDTPGFGDNVDNSNSFKRILDYIENQYKRFLAEESRVQRNAKFQDTRVHVIVYFIPPSGHSYPFLFSYFLIFLFPYSLISLFPYFLFSFSFLKFFPFLFNFSDTLIIIHIFLFLSNSLRDLDIFFMKQLGKRTNILPVVAKADSLTPTEMKDFKKRVCFHIPN